MTTRRDLANFEMNFVVSNFLNKGFRIKNTQLPKLPKVMMLMKHYYEH